MSDEDDTAQTILDKLERHASFEPITCCGKRVGIVNVRPFNAEAAAKFERIRQSHVTVEDPLGNAWQDDPAARSLMDDPASYQKLAEGHRFTFFCPACGASFVQAGGKPVRVPREVA